MNNDTIHVRMSRRLIQELDAQAKRIGKTRTALVRDAAEQFLSDSRLAEQMKRTQADILEKQGSQALALEIIGLQTSEILNMLRDLNGQGEQQ